MEHRPGNIPLDTPGDAYSGAVKSIESMIRSFDSNKIAHRYNLLIFISIYWATIQGDIIISCET